MQRLREIQQLTEAHEEALAGEHERLALTTDSGNFPKAWREIAESWGFDEVNDLVIRHNQWFPVESRLPMDPKRGDFALVNGRDYRLPVLDAAWVLERFPV